MGKFLENLAFLALRRRTPEIHCCTSLAGFEVDFYLPETRELIQVSQNLAQPATRDCEMRALTDAMQGLGLTHGLILTDANAEPILESGLTIEIRSLAEWLLLSQAATGIAGEVEPPGDSLDHDKQLLILPNDVAYRSIICVASRTPV